MTSSNQGLNNNALLIGETGQIRASTSIWYNQKVIDAMGMRYGGSAVFTAPDADTVGGWQMDLGTDYVYFGFVVRNDWDAASDVLVKITFEVNVDNGGGTGTDYCALIWQAKFKGNGETSTKSQNATNNVTVGACSQYTQFTETINIDYDDGSNPVQAGDVFGFRLGIGVLGPDVANLIINEVEILYQSTQPNALEV